MEKIRTKILIVVLTLVVMSAFNDILYAELPASVNAARLKLCRSLDKLTIETHTQAVALAEASLIRQHLNVGYFIDEIDILSYTSFGQKRYHEVVNQSQKVTPITADGGAPDPIDIGPGYRAAFDGIVVSRETPGFGSNVLTKDSKLAPYSNALFHSYWMQAQHIAFADLWSMGEKEKALKCGILSREDWTVQDEFQNLGGYSCQVLESNTEKIYLIPEYDYIVLRRDTLDLKSGEVTERFDCDDFRKDELDTWFPFSVTFTRYNGGKSLLRYTIDVKKMSRTDMQKVVDSKYQLKFTPGQIIIDESSNNGDGMLSYVMPADESMLEEVIESAKSGNPFSSRRGDRLFWIVINAVLVLVLLLAFMVRRWKIRNARI